MLQPQAITKAHQTIAPYIKHTPVLTSSYLNDLLGANLLFKCEGLQTTGAFKIRGALHALLALKEKGELPTHVVAYSSGNHAQAVAYACKMLDIKATLFIPENAAPIKIEATKSYGATVVLTKNKAESETAAKGMQQQGAYFLHPFDNDDVILGQGTSCYEALADGHKPDAIFAPIGGGGLISGTLLATQLMLDNAKVIAAEPAMANDAWQSYKSGSIVSLKEDAKTIADGARTLSVCDRTFEYIQQLDDIIQVQEEQIKHWARMLFLHLKVTVETTSALALAACSNWLETQDSNKRRTVLIILSGSNIDKNSYKMLWGD
jgi:threonine dehydratase